MIKADEILLDLLEQSYMQYLKLPDIMSYPSCISMVELKDQQYYFKYTWNTRSGLLYLSIYKIIDDKEVYYLKNYSLINNVSLSRYIHDQDWSGGLYFQNINNNTLDAGYRKDTISDDFYIKYVSDRT